MQKLVIYGIGEHFSNTVKMLQDRDRLDEFMEGVIAISDTNKSRHGTKFLGKTIVDPAEIKDMEYDLVLIGTSRVYLNEIKTFLIHNCSIDPKKIARLDEHMLANVGLNGNGGGGIVAYKHLMLKAMAKHYSLCEWMPSRLMIY